MATTKWSIDPTHSEVGFKVKHMMFTNVSGKFTTYEATITNEESAFETTKINFNSTIGSIDTNNTDRDNHLKSADFFDAENFPTLNFTATSIQKVNANQFQIMGDLTIKDVTKSVTLDAEYSGILKDPWGNTKVAMNISGKINRKEFGLNWNAALETGGVLVGEDVKLEVELQLLKQ